MTLMTNKFEWALHFYDEFLDCGLNLLVSTCLTFFWGPHFCLHILAHFNIWLYFTATEQQQQVGIGYTRDKLLKLVIIIYIIAYIKYFVLRDMIGR
jgi:hypothetical protein